MDFRGLSARAQRVVGLELSPVGHLERWVSALTGMVAIFVLVWMQAGLVDDAGSVLLVGSMGASAVLLFAVPHGALSQPWPVLVGHCVSAFVGVAAARYAPNLPIAAALAVGLAIGAMHYLRAIHPPGGATALSAVIGGAQVKALGYGYVVTPVMFSAAVLVCLAVLLNAAFKWRRYPGALGVAHKPDTRGTASLTHADFVAALRRHGTFVDISEDEFLRLGQLMSEAAEHRRVRAEDIRLGAYYSNATTGQDWSVRQIIDAAAGSEGKIIWRSVAGFDRYETGLSTRREFAAWASYEVVRAENAWTRPTQANAA